MKLNTLLKEYAKSAKIPYVDYHTAMKDADNGLPKKYAVMESIILEYL